MYTHMEPLPSAPWPISREDYIRLARYQVPLSRLMPPGCRPEDHALEGEPYPLTLEDCLEALKRHLADVQPHFGGQPRQRACRRSLAPGQNAWYPAPGGPVACRVLKTYRRPASHFPLYIPALIPPPPEPPGPLCPL